MKARMRGDLVDAIKGKRAEEVSLLRSLLAAIDNAEAPAHDPRPASIARGPSEVDRLVLSVSELRTVITAEIETRERAAAELAGLGQRTQAETLLGQAALATRYLAPA
jgi:uncharacterized protein YqeY